ncbi:MAG: DUF3667 domain-containing protein [Archangium sp.]|nr:DUF3667 domain-containing protein [Archangium sp.]
MSGEIEAAGAALTAGLAASAIDGSKGHGDGGHGACANCGAELHGNYCAVCGQPAHVHRTLGHMVEEFLHGLLHFDTRAWRTLPLLAFRPGTLTNEYIHGKRARYISPLALFLLTVFTMFFVFAFTGGAMVNGDGTQATASAAEMRANIATLETEAATANAEMARARAALDAIPPTIAEDDPAREAAVAAFEAAEETADDKARDIRTLQRTLSVVERVTAEAPKAVPGAEAEPVKVTGMDLFYEEISQAAHNGDITVNTGFKTVDKKILEKLKNPELAIYKIQNTAYKFSFLLVPISLPFMWLLFFWKRGVTLFDHAVFVLYSLSFMSLLFVIGALLSMWVAPLLEGFLAVTSLAIPVHIYFQLKGAYSLGWFSALWRTFFLLIFCALALSLFLLAIIVLGLAG